MITIIKNSFTFKSIFSLRKEKGLKFVLYFIIVIFLMSLPQNLAIVRNDGFEFNNIVIELNELANSNPMEIIEKLPDGSIEKTSFLMDSRSLGNITTKKFEIAFFARDEKYESKKNLVAFEYDKVVYYDGNGNKLVGDYHQLNSRINLTALKNKADMPNANQTEVAKEFIMGVRQVFSPYFIAQGVGVTLLGNFLLNTLLLFIVSAILLLIRINYKKVASYLEYLKIYIASFTIPVLIGVTLALISYKYLATFSQVLIQWGTPLMAVGAIFLGSKKETSEKTKRQAKERKKKSAEDLL